MLQKLAVPIAIVIAGGLIAGALYFVNAGAPTIAPTDAEPTVAENIRGPQEDDHIRGNPNAPIVIVEYSDTECPFCQRYHETMKRIIDEYGPEGKVAWIYRHFPLAQLHSKAPVEAHALECANELGGSDAFWKYTDRIYEITPTNNGLDLTELPKIAEFAGVDVAAFNECMESGRHTDRIERDVAEAVAAGGRGTPHSIVLFDNEQVPIEGAQPYEVVKGLIDTLLEQ